MDNLRGILLMSLAMAAFSLEDTALKLLTQRLPLGQILVVLGLGGACVFAALARLRGAALISPAFLSRPVVLRNLGEMAATLCFVSALARVPLSVASAILQATPLAVTLGAAVFLGAPVGWRRWSAIAAGFLGVLIVVRPGLDGFQPAALLAVGAVASLAIRDLATRVVPARISTLVLAAYAFAIVALAGLALSAVGPPPLVPDGREWALLAFCIAVGGTGYYAVTAAMRVGEVAVVAPFRYSRLVFAILLGMAVFGERPDAWMLLGAALIIASGLYTLAREQRLGRRPLSPLPPPG